MKKLKFWKNGKFFEETKACVSLSDRGFLYGDGIFETMRAYDGAVFMLEAHMERLFASLEVVKIKPPFSKAALKSAVRSCIRKNALKSAYIRLTITRGEGKFGIDVSGLGRSNAVIAAKELIGPPEEFYERGIKVIVAKSTRQNESSPLARVKSLNFLNYVMARMEAREKGFDEAVILNTKGYVAEGASSNIFIVKGGCLITPSVESGILPGVTRGVIMDIAAKHKIVVTARRIGAPELLSADEIFITNSIQEVVPVVMVGSKKIGSGTPGKTTKLLRTYYRFMIQYPQ